MATGDSSFMGRGMGLDGEYLLTQQTSGTDAFTIQGASSAETGSATLFTVQMSAATPAVNGFRVFPYGRTRLIRTDDQAYGGSFKNALDVKYDLDYAAGASQIYGATIILDTAGGSWSGGRFSVLQLQAYGDSGVSNGQAASWLHINDLGSTEVGSFLNILGVSIDTGCVETVSNPNATQGLVIYIENVKYWILVADSSAA